MFTALLPLKDLVQAKSRLAGLLGPSERRALAQAMAEDVLCVLAAHAGVERVVIVSDDPGADLLARTYGAACWPERELGCRGLNPVLQCASARLFRSGAARLLVLHADLPLLGADDITAALDAPPATLVLGPDRRGTGTNLLAFGAAQALRFRFGADSRARHVAAARRAGVPVHLVQRPGVALDVDEPRDLVALLRALKARPNAQGATAHLLRGGDLGRRLERALSSLSVGDERSRERGNSGGSAC